jgi:hypothetical protein
MRSNGSFGGIPQTVSLRGSGGKEEEEEDLSYSVILL